MDRGQDTGQFEKNKEKMIMKQVKRVFAFLLAAAMMFTLAACGGDSSSSTDAATQSAGTVPEAAGDKIVIAYWTTNRHDMEYMTPLIEEFNNTNDHIYIDYQVYADNYSQMLDLTFSTNSAPDVFQLSGSDAIDVQVREKNMLMSLSDFMTEEDIARYNSFKAQGKTGMPT